MAFLGRTVRLGLHNNFACLVKEVDPMLTPLRRAGNLITRFMMLILTMLILRVGNWILGFMLMIQFRQVGSFQNQVFMNEYLLCTQPFAT